MHLYETHLPVADTKIAESFYWEVVGLPMAHRDTTRDIVFLWADEKQEEHDRFVGREHGLRSSERSAHAMSLGVCGFIRTVAARHHKVERTWDRNVRVRRQAHDWAERDRLDAIGADLFS